MNKKYLAEYSSKESASFRKYVNNFIKDPNAQYPTASRFGSLKEPVIHADSFAYAYDKEKIWSQIPLAGTLIISLSNVTEKHCLEVNGFEPSDIPKLIEFSKTTDKIKFALSTNPLYFEGLDYLDPIFQEFEPPELMGLEESFFIEHKQIQQFCEEFRELAKINFENYVIQRALSFDENRFLWKKHMTGRMGTYSKLKLLGMNNEIILLQNLMIDEPEYANMLFEYFMFFINPIFDPLTQNYGHGLSKLHRYGLEKLQQNPNIVLPEIGKHVTKKLIPDADDFERCTKLVEQYSDNDLYKIMQAFNTSIKNQKQHEIISDKQELEIILDNVWNETKRMQNQKNAIELGIETTIGLLGFATSFPLGTFGGLLAGLGFKISDQYLNFGSSTLSELIVKKLRAPSLVNIYNFKKKYKIS